MTMKHYKLVMAGLVCGAAALAQAQMYGDLPDAKHAWGVHDWNRPNPAKITAECCKVPSDATVLFDGKNLDAWLKAKDGSPAHWTLIDGAMEATKDSGIRTKQSFGDCQLHIEWASPTVIRGEGQGRGNSGVFFMDRYEVQVLDSYESRTYADGQASAIYGQNPPLVNATRAPGEWNTYDIIFHQPRWDGNTLVSSGSITVLHNGVLTQDNWEYDGEPWHKTRRGFAKHPDKGPLSLQFHGDPVRFRNIWIREIPAREENTTHGTKWVKEEHVMQLRAQTASKLFAAKPAPALNDILEVLSYDATPQQYRDVYEKLAADAAAKINAYTKDEATAKKGELKTLEENCTKLVKAKAIPADAPLLAAVKACIQKYNLR